MRIVLFCFANGHIQQSTKIEITKSVSPSISDQSGSDPSRRALFIMFNGVNTFPIEIQAQGGQRAFLLEMQLPIYGRDHYHKILYQHNYEPVHKFTKLTPNCIDPRTIRHFSHSLNKLFPTSIFSSAQRERRNVITVTYSLENSWELLSNIYFY